MKSKLHLFIILIFFVYCHIDKKLDLPESSKTVQCLTKEYGVENLCDDEKRYLDWAKSQKQYTKLNQLNRETLHNITQETLDVDKAAALFYYRAIEEPQNKKFLSYLDKKQYEIVKKVPDFSKKNILFVMIPGMFYKDNPQVGADGKSFRVLANKLGMKDVLIPIDQTGTVQNNAKIICDFIEKENESNGMIIASVSKGSSEFKLAIKECGDKEFFKKVKGWYNVGGVNKGTEVINEVQGNWRYRTESKLYFWWKGYKYDGFLSMRYIKNGPLDFDLEIPKHIMTINVIAVPQFRFVTERARPFYEHLIRFGPNDGMTLLGDSYMEGAITFPSWRNDHYFQWAIYQERVQAIMVYMIENQFK